MSRSYSFPHTKHWIAFHALSHSWLLLNTHRQTLLHRVCVCMSVCNEAPIAIGWYSSPFQLVVVVVLVLSHRICFSWTLYVQLIFFLNRLVPSRSFCALPVRRVWWLQKKFKETLMANKTTTAATAVTAVAATTEIEWNTKKNGSRYQSYHGDVLFDWSIAHWPNQWYSHTQCIIMLMLNNHFL